VAVPIHWGTLSPILARRKAGPGPEESPAEEFARHASALAPGVRVVVLPTGETVEV
jgi:hypothetical protein